MRRPTLVIAGASHAGVQLAASAREQGFDGAIVMIGDEPHAPYQRPPLSKGLLTGKTTPGQLALRAESFYAENDIELRLGERVAALDPQARRVVLGDGSALAYDWLALAVGARCRPLPVPGGDLDGVACLRTMDDALRIAQASEQAGRVCIVGGGFIGLEVAAALAQRGATVTVVEAQPRLLARSVPALVSDFIAEAHRGRGVGIECACGIERLVGDAGRVRAVELSDGRRIDCDLVIAGIGVLPNVELAREAGLAVGNGIEVDTLGRTSAPKVFAAGDCAAMPTPFARRAGHRVRPESIQFANDSARAIASVLVGQERPHLAVPWFWSDQFDLKLQMTGLADPADEVVLRGRVDDGRFTAFFLSDGVIVAAHSVNRPAEHMIGRRLVAAAARVDARLLADESVDLKGLTVAA